MLTRIFTRPLLMSILSLLLLFCNPLFSQQSDQKLSQLPELEPSFTNHFNSENGKSCFEDIVLDDMGRLWLIPCKKSRLLNFTALQYYDGYQLHNYELKDDQGIVTGNVRLGGVTKNGYLYGVIYKIIFLSNFNNEITNLYPIPFPDKGYDHVSAVTETPQGDLEAFISWKFLPVRRAFIFSMNYQNM